MNYLKEIVMGNEPLTLLELNSLVKQSIRTCLPDEYWVRAELSDVRYNVAGHCYVEFIQKSGRGDSLVAKARGTIWSNIFSLLRPYFEETTGQRFTAGIKVLVKVNVEFHELYGYSLTVLDIDPAYTLGDMAKRRREILKKLEEEGVLNLNKELSIPMLPQRVAVISSPTAAGYGDFSNQIINNSRGYQFFTSLFPAIMQGDRVEETVIEALNKINEERDNFDVVVIIRGGGATSDLSGFDTYELAANCAQFPLPIITGIGHERDDTIIDIVANTRVKTPTAAAALLIEKMDIAANTLHECHNSIMSGVENILDFEVKRLEQLKREVFDSVSDRIKDERHRWQKLSMIISSSFARMNVSEQNRIERIKDKLSVSAKSFLVREKHKLEILEHNISNSSPKNILKRGYSLTLSNGKVVRDKDSVNDGDELTTLLYDGEIKSVVNKK